MPASARGVGQARDGKSPTGGWYGARETEKGREREREVQKEKKKERERSRQELESGWTPPEIDSTRVVVPGGGGRKRGRGNEAYKSPRVSVPPKSRVVSEYL